MLRYDGLMELVVTAGPTVRVFDAQTTALLAVQAPFGIGVPYSLVAAAPLSCELPTPRRPPSGRGR